MERMDITTTIILIILFIFVGYFFGCATGAYTERRHWQMKQDGPVQYERGDAHEHRYTYMKGDGWHCGECGRLKPKEK